jgi:hypothetical protein
MADKPLSETVKLKLEAEGDHYVLSRLDVRREQTVLRLSEMDLLDLARSLPQFASRQFSDLTETARDAGMQSVAAARVTRTSVTPAALGEAVIMVLEDQAALKVAYALDAELARHTGEALISRSGMLGGAIKGRG